MNHQIGPDAQIAQKIPLYHNNGVQVHQNQKIEIIRMDIVDVEPEPVEKDGQRELDLIRLGRDRFLRHIPLGTMINDAKHDRVFEIGNLLGKGGFANCFVTTERETRKKFAIKIISRQILATDYQLEKLTQEIVLHKNIRHENIVKFYTYFQDSESLYLILELCSNGSLADLVATRGYLHEIEAKYFLRQISSGLEYLHRKDIIHRDLKPANVLIHENMTAKIADLGLAAHFEYVGERKKTMCGTPNYISPELLNKKGHSFETDIWSVGVLLYFLLSGKAPFETPSQQSEEVYRKILALEYTLPSNIFSEDACALLKSIFVEDLSQRATLSHIIYSKFMTRHQIPATLPSSILTVAPTFVLVNPDENGPKKIGGEIA